MADSIFKRAGEAMGLTFSKAAPTQTLGTTRSTGSRSLGEGSGTFDEPDYELNLVGQRRFEYYAEMVRDVAIIGAGVRLFLNLISNAVWTVNPPEDLPEAQQEAAQKIADQCYDMLFGMTTSWSSVVKKTAAFRFIGFSIQEWTAKQTEDGAIGLKDIEHRPQRTIVRWNRDEGGTVESVVQRVPGRSDVELPRSKIVYAVDDTLTDSPEGVGLFRHMAKTAARLEQFMDLEEIGFTTDLRGIPIARAPLGELLAEVEAAGPSGSEDRALAEARRSSRLQPLKDFVQKHMRNKNTGVLLPSDTFLATGVDKSTTPSAVHKWVLELLNGDSQSFSDMREAIREMKQDLARLMGTEHLLLGSDGSGSLALARSKIGTFYLTVTSTLLDLLEVYDRDVIAPLAELNGWPEELIPEMGVNEIADRDIEATLEAFAKLAQAGAPMMPDDPAVGEIYDTLGYTRPPERGDELDLSLNPGRTAPKPKPKDPANDDLKDNPEDQRRTVVKVLRSRQNMSKSQKRR